MGAVIFSHAIATRIGNGEHGSTFGGGPLACAAAKATVDVIIDEQLPANSRAQGDYLMRTLREAGPNVIRIGRGRATRYGVRQSWPNLGASRFPMFSVTENGTARSAGARR